MAPPRICGDNIKLYSLLLIYRPRKDERLSLPSWLTYSGRFTHISGHPSAVCRVPDSESSPVKDQRSTSEPRNHAGCRGPRAMPPQSHDRFFVLLLAEFVSSNFFIELLVFLQFLCDSHKTGTHDLCANMQKNCGLNFPIF